MSEFPRELSIVNVREVKKVSAELSVEIISDDINNITIAILLKGRLISIVSGNADIVFAELTKLFRGVKVLSC